jgi:hypothetical protein
MLESITDVDRIASSAICVDHFATRRIVKAPSLALASEVKAWMEINDFDVAPVQGSEQPMVVIRSELVDLEDDRVVITCARSVDNDLLVPSSTTLPKSLEILRTHGWFLVYDNGEITGIVTRSDMERPAISIYIFARLISLEHGLRRLLGSYSNTPITDVPPSDAHTGGPKYLSDVLKAIRAIPALVEDLGFTSKSAFDRGTGFVVDLRNHLAHGRSILAQASDAKGAVKRIFDLDQLVSRISCLLTERQQVWNAFETTTIVQKTEDEIVWAGSGSVMLPLPTPIHIITAYNPFEHVLSNEENNKRHEALRRILLYRPVQFLSVYGQSPDGQWVEPSYAVYGFTRSEACALARDIGQRAIFELDDRFLYVFGSDEQLRGQRPRHT